MSLIVENGTGVANAQTFASEGELVAYAAARGVTLTVEQATPLLIEAMDRMTGLDYLGNRVLRDQALDFPRIGICIDSFWYASTDLPAMLKQAQLAFALAANAVDLMPTVDTDAKGQKIRSTVGPITTEWAQRPGGPARYAKVPAADRLLAKLLRGGEGTIKVVRA